MCRWLVYWESWWKLLSHVHTLLGLLDVLLDLRCDVEVEFLRHGQRQHGRLHHLRLPPEKTGYVRWKKKLRPHWVHLIKSWFSHAGSIVLSLCFNSDLKKRRKSKQTAAEPKYSLTISRVFDHMVNQGHDGRSFGRGVLVVCSTCPVFSDNELKERTRKSWIGSLTEYTESSNVDLAGNPPDQTLRMVYRRSHFAPDCLTCCSRS